MPTRKLAMVDFVLSCVRTPGMAFQEPCENKNGYGEGMTEHGQGSNPFDLVDRGQGIIEAGWC